MKSYLATDDRKKDDDPENRKPQTSFDMKLQDIKVWSQINNGVEKR